MTNPFQHLQNWYEQHCNGDWEHQYGVRIETLDNPGWEVSIDLADTSLLTCAFEEISIEREENDWVRCRVREGRYEGFGGPRNLEELVRVFLAWAEESEVQGEREA
jgi:hypothetical protein